MKTFLLLIVFFAPVLVKADTIVIDGICYSLTETEAIVTKNPNYSGNIIIPETILYNEKIYNITGIGDEAFRNCSGLTSLSIGGNVTNIGNSAFYNCVGLSSLSIPDNVESIGDYAFENCSGLTFLAIGKRVKSIGKEAFLRCDNLTNITIPKSVISIKYDSFSPQKLTSIFVEEGNPKYDSRNNCNAIIETESNTLIIGCVNSTIPNSVTSIGEHAFEFCPITSIEIPVSIINIGINAFYCSSLKSITIPNSVVSIGDNAFSNCDNLTNVLIPNSVTIMGNSVFAGCNELTSASVGDGLTTIGDFSFSECRKLKSVSIGKKIKIIGEMAFFLCNFISNIDFPKSLSTIKERAFYGCNHLKTLTIPYNVTTIEKQSFGGCSGITDIYCYNDPSNLTWNFSYRLGENDFKDNKETVFHVLDKEKWERKFSGANVTFDDSEGLSFKADIKCDEDNWMTYYSSYANLIADEQTEVYKVVLDGDIMDLSKVNERIIPKEEAVLLRSSTTSINLKVSTLSSTTSFSDNSLKGSISEVISDGDYFILDYNNNDLGFRKVSCGTTIPGYHGYLKSSSSYDLYSLRSKIDYSGVSYIVDILKKEAKIVSKSTGKYEGKVDIPEYIIHEGIRYNVTCIGKDAFSYSNSLVSITIPSCITTIEENAFRGCSSLKELIILSEVVPNTELNAFEESNIENATLYVPSKSLNDYKSTEPWNKFLKIEIELISPLTIIAKDYSIEYGDELPTFEFSSTGSTFEGTPTISCEATSASSVGTYPIVITKGSVTNYNTTFVNGTLTIEKAPLTITAKSYTIKQGEDLPTFEATYEGFKNNETSTVLTKQPAITTTATSASEPGEYEITISGAEAKNYEISYVKGKLTIAQADAVTVKAKSYTIKYGDELPKFEFTSEGATLKGTPEIKCEATNKSPVGTYTIVISKGSVTNYNDTYVNGTLTIEKAPLTITAKSYTIKQGEDLPTFEATCEGFKNNETSTVLTKQPAITTAATSASEPGEYEITISGAEAKNYEISYVKGKLTIAKADAVTVKAKSYTIKYGDELPKFEFTSEGATLKGTPEIKCEATSKSPVGTYTIVISKGSVTNYNDTYVNGTLTIEKAPLTITAKSYTIKQGEDLPTFEATYEGFKNNETSAVLTKQPTITTTATSASAPGEYEITVSGAEAQNYEFSYVAGKLTIEAVEIVPINETEEKTFSQQVDETTDLENTVIDNTYYNMDATNGDGYDATEQALVLNSTTSSTQMSAVQGAQVGDAAVRENFSGIIFEIPAGQGVVTVDAKTIGTHVLNVQIGNGTPTQVKKSERGTVEVEYNVSAPTYVYLYASTESGASARLYRGPSAGANSVLLYGYKVQVGGTGIEELKNGKMEELKYYDLNGRKVKTPRKGVYIINGKKVVVK